jgi:SAM-dependent methyltransferase
VPGAARNQCAGPFGAVYDFYIERPRLMGAIGRLVWGIDASVIYRALDVVSSAGDGATILDVPCGGGVALRALRPDQDVRYIAADISERMLARTRRRAAARGLRQVEVVHTDMLALPFEDASMDVVLSLSGIHMVAEQELAVRELARCCRPGGTLVGATFLREGSGRQRRLFETGSRSGHALPPRLEDLRGWLRDGGVEQAEIAPEAGLAVFRGRQGATR